MCCTACGAKRLGSGITGAEGRSPRAGGTQEDPAARDPTPTRFRYNRPMGAKRPKRHGPADLDGPCARPLADQLRDMTGAVRRIDHPRGAALVGHDVDLVALAGRVPELARRPALDAALQAVAGRFGRP